MDLYCFKLNLLFLLSFIFISCESMEIIEDQNINSDFYYNNVSAFYNHFDGDNQILSVYLEFLDYIDNIESISGTIKNNDEVLYNFDFVNLDLNSNVFIVEDILINNNQPILSDNIYLYDMDINILFTDETIYSFSSELTTPIDPDIIDYIIPENFQIDSTEWKSLLINVEIKDLNGFSNIQSVKYEIKRILLNGCINDCIIDNNCNEDIVDENYSSDDTWAFDYIESTTDSTYNYSKEILIRPLDGSALYDDDGNIIFSASDCGRTGIIEFKLVVFDKDGLSDEIDNILMEITE
jgi:hypothetical protein